MGRQFFKLADNIVSLFVMVSAFFLVAFMAVQIISAPFQFWEIVSDFSSGGVHSFTDNALTILHIIAIIVILVKAYKILESYAKTHHLSIKYLVEINIVASSLELLFNSSSYELEMLVLFTILGLGSLLLYCIFYKTLQQADVDC